jgi:cytochrome c2
MKALARGVVSLALLSVPCAFLRAEVGASTSAAGKRQFTKCMACHSLEQGVNMMGPSLAGLLGRKAGSVEGFNYSAAMRQSRIVWNRETLAAFLENPGQYVPGTTMPFAGLAKPGPREALIEFLLSPK